MFFQSQDHHFSSVFSLLRDACLMMSIILDRSVSTFRVSSLISSWPAYSLTLTLSSCEPSSSYLNSNSLPSAFDSSR